MSLPRGSVSAWSINLWERLQKVMSNEDAWEILEAAKDEISETTTVTEPDAPEDCYDGEGGQGE